MYHMILLNDLFQRNEQNNCKNVCIKKLKEENCKIENYQNAINDCIIDCINRKTEKQIHPSF